MNPATTPDPRSVAADLFEMQVWADLIGAAPAALARGLGLEVRSVGGATACVAPGIPTHFSFSSKTAFPSGANLSAM